MAQLPLVGQAANPGIYQVCTTANTDYVITVPTGAVGVRLWFETSAANGTLIRGRVAISTSNSAIAGITDTDGLLGHHPPQMVHYDMKRSQAAYQSTPVYSSNYGTAYLHVANATALAVVRGHWLFE